MPSIDYNGIFFVTAISTAKQSTGALRFPVKASRATTARRFADKVILRDLPGWSVGVAALCRKRKRVDSWILRRGD